MRGQDQRDAVRGERRNHAALRAAKPAPEVFTAALAALAVEPADAVFVGDSPFHDVAGAQAAGMTAVLVGDRRAEDVRPDAQVTSVAELPSLLDRLR